MKKHVFYGTLLYGEYLDDFPLTWELPDGAYLYANRTWHDKYWTYVPETDVPAELRLLALIIT